MSFLEINFQLQSLYRLQHDLSNQIDGAAFAEDKGQLSIDERALLELKQNEFDRLEKEVVVIREELQNTYSKDYISHLSSIHKNLSLIQNHLNALQGEIEFKQSFNKTLCHSLLADLSKHIQGKKIKNTFYWLFDVSTILIEEYSSFLNK